MKVKDAGRTPTMKDMEKRPFPVRPEVQIQKSRITHEPGHRAFEGGKGNKRRSK